MLPCGTQELHSEHIARRSTPCYHPFLASASALQPIGQRRRLLVPGFVRVISRERIRLTFNSWILVISSQVCSVKGLSIAIPAHGTRPSRLPKNSIAFANESLSSASTMTLVFMYFVLAPKFSDNVLYSSTGFSWISNITTLPPISHMARAQAKPIPCAPPVTM